MTPLLPSARPTMADLLLRVRTLISDPMPNPPTMPNFQDLQIQQALDQHRIEQRLIPLMAQPTLLPGSGVLYLDYYAGTGNWEADVVLQNIHYDTITPDLSELIVGHWHFNTQPAGIAVRATGKTYDLYGAAADLLDSWAAQVKFDFDFTDTRTQYARNQKFQMITALAQKYRALGTVVTTRASQYEIATEYDGGPAVTYPTIGSFDGY